MLRDASPDEDGEDTAGHGRHGAPALYLAARSRSGEIDVHTNTCPGSRSPASQTQFGSTARVLPLGALGLRQMALCPAFQSAF
jgi:hypothetical protein